ncbi:hypothetical protein PC115_g8882 [Phytophthora cactorum]|uniref:Uncharacterized protein n=1 Tax=Phytophthora cactorum TaxID=29920 RepID=A0A8T1CIG6_9STRA|nr:hypothetical protein PC115_g8882 [Phytophthora cactorum]
MIQEATKGRNVTSSDGLSLSHSREVPSIQKHETALSTSSSTSDVIPIVEACVIDNVRASNVNTARAMSNMSSEFKMPSNARISGLDPTPTSLPLVCHRMSWQSTRGIAQAVVIHEAVVIHASPV